MAPSAYADQGGCTSPTDGVTVIVQFPTATEVGCAPGAPTNALNALRGAGFTTTGTVQYGDAFLCSINGYPMSTLCPRTPPASAYWSEWTAPRGGKWFYAQWGVTLQKVPVGSVLGFHFGGTAEPSMAVPAPFPTTSNTKSPTAVTSKTVSTQAPAKTSGRPASQAPAKSTSAKPNGAASQSAKSTASSKQSASTTPTAASTQPPAASARSAYAAANQGSPAAPAPVVKATQTVHEGNTSKVVVTYSDGSKATVAPSAAASSQYKVGATKSVPPTSMAQMSTKAAAPTASSSHPSIWTSGSAPVVEPMKTGSSNLPGIIAGVGVVGVVAAGGAVAIRRRG